MVSTQAVILAELLTEATKEVPNGTLNAVAYRLKLFKRIRDANRDIFHLLLEILYKLSILSTFATP